MGAYHKGSRWHTFLQQDNTDNLAKMDAMLLEIQQRSRIVPIDISIARLGGNIGAR